MKSTYKIALFGHRFFSEHKKVEKRLFQILRGLAESNHFIEIYIGRNGEFDAFSASVIKTIKKELYTDNITMTLVLPYPNNNLEYYEEYYDNIIIPTMLSKTHPKGAITKRNKWMVVESEMIIFYVDHEGGGAYSALKYAKKLKKKIINLAQDDLLTGE